MSDRKVPACPECDSTREIQQRTTKTPEWACHVCGARFNEANWRPPKKEPHPTGTKRRLLEADADDIPGGDAA